MTNNGIACSGVDTATALGMVKAGRTVWQAAQAGQRGACLGMHRSQHVVLAPYDNHIAQINVTPCLLPQRRSIQLAQLPIEIVHSPAAVTAQLCA